MAGIQTAIELQDNFSSVMYGIINSVNLSVAAMYDMQQSLSADLDTSSLEGAREEIAQATAALYEMNEALQNQPALNVPQTRPEPATQPASTPEGASFAWTSDNLEVFNTAGLERWEQEVQSANQMLATLNQTQQQIVQTASGIDILPFSAMQDIDAMEMRLQGLQQRIQQMEADPISFGTEAANAQLEQLRTKLSQAVQEQGELNAALQRMDVSAANAAYLRLSRTVSATEGYIRDNVDQQARFNQEIRAGTAESNNLMNSIGRMVAAYVSIQSVGKVIDLSDSLTQTTARLDLMNDGLQSTEELVNMVYGAAQDARGSFSEMADVVARFGNNARDAFSSSEEVVAFAGLVQKQMTIAGASTQEASNAMLQLSQALGSGVLRGDELNSIFEQAPNLIQNIADYMDVPLGQIRDMASEGELSADIVKAAVFSAADEINERFESIPMTWGQALQSFQNTAMIVFQPVLQRLNDIANSEAFQDFVNNALGAMAGLANIVLDVFDLMGTAGAFVADNWSIIGPIVYGVAAALSVYYGRLLLVKGLEAASAVASGAMAIGKGLLAAATVLATGATWSQVTAQMGLNSAMYACPIVWIIMLIIALIAIFYAAIAAINKFAGTSYSATGIICGAFAMGVAFTQNLIVGAINTIIRIGIELYNLIAAFANFFANVFNDPVGAIIRLFADLFDFICGIVEAAAGLIDTVLGSDLSGAVAGFRADFSNAVDEIVGDQVVVMEKLDASDYLLERVNYGDAFDAGYSFGEGIEDKVSSFFDFDTGGGQDKRQEMEDSLLDSLGGISDGLGGIADDTGAIKDSIDVSEEDLKYLRDLAEQEAVNRFTTAEIKLDMTTNNNVSSSTDLDGIIDGMTTKVLEAMEMVKEGV